MIKNPMLPPKRGYVEVVVEGKHTYRNVETGALIKSAIEEQIAELKAELSATDYKIIKCSEAQLVGETLPYDIAVLHAERQALRDNINALERGDGA